MKIDNMETLTKTAKRKAPRAPQSFEEAALDFENSKIIGLKLSRKIAWSVAAASILLALLCVVGLLLALFNHNDPEPLVLKQNTITGEITALRSVKDATDKYDEVTDKYWIAAYVRYRQSYDWYTIGTESEIVKLMSEDAVATEYMNGLQLSTAPLNMLKDKAKIVTKISSITFLGDMAQVRFTTQRLSTSGENLDGSPEQSWIATLSYKFVSGVMTEQQRLMNPAGYKTITYRVDAEVLK